MLNQSILFVPIAGEKELYYQVTIKNQSKDSNKGESVLRYNCLITFKKQSWNGYIVNFIRKDLSLDHIYKNEPIFEVFLKSGEILNDIDLEIASNGEIAHIDNWKKIKKKWEEIKFKIESTYKGKIVEQIVSQMDISLQTEKSAISSFNKDPFFLNFLMGVYGYYKNDKIIFEGDLRGFIPKYRLPIIKTNKILKDSMVGTYTIKSSSVISQNDIKNLREKLRIRDEDVLKFDLNSEYILSKEKIMNNIFAENVLYKNGIIMYNSKVKIQRIIV